MSSEMLQELDFSEGALRKDLLAEDIGDLLDCDAFLGLPVGGSTVGAAVSKGLQEWAQGGLSHGASLTRQYHRHPDQALSSRCISHPR